MVPDERSFRLPNAFAQLIDALTSFRIESNLFDFSFLFRNKLISHQIWIFQFMNRIYHDISSVHVSHTLNCMGDRPRLHYRPVWRLSFVWHIKYDCFVNINGFYGVAQNEVNFCLFLPRRFQSREMASRPSCPSEKKVLMRKANLSSTVLDYYNKFGQNRDLEKYLRLRRQNSSKSSSDGSLYNFERTNTAAETERVRKSLQKLNVSDGKDAKVASATPDANAVEASSGARGKPTEKSSAATGEQIKIQKILRKKSKSKSYNVSMESNIEINMPPPPPSYSLPELTNRADLTTADSLKSMPKQLQFQSCETQTASPLPSDIPQSTTQVTPIDGSQVVPHVVEQVVAQVVESVVKSKPTTEECAVETSPASSIASAKTRLEWDSMADVGYKQIIDFKSKSNSNLSTFEKDALTKFFARRGLNFDDKLVIIASPDERTKLQKRKITKSAIEMRQKSYNESWRSFSKPDKNNKRDEEPTTSRSGRGHWKMALMKYQEKYGRAPETDETLQPPSDSLQLSQPQGHSTPFTIEASGTSAGGDDPKLHNRAEKSCQTSYSQLKIERKQSVASVGIQIDIGEWASQTNELQGLMAFQILNRWGGSNRARAHCRGGTIRKSWEVHAKQRSEHDLFSELRIRCGEILHKFRRPVAHRRKCAWP